MTDEQTANQEPEQAQTEPQQEEQQAPQEPEEAPKEEDSKPEAESQPTPEPTKEEDTKPQEVSQQEPQTSDSQNQSEKEEKEESKQNSSEETKLDEADEEEVEDEAALTIPHILTQKEADDYNADHEGEEKAEEGETVMLQLDPIGAIKYLADEIAELKRIIYLITQVKKTEISTPDSNLMSTELKKATKHLEKKNKPVPKRNTENAQQPTSRQ
jgi:hypothetical protein